VRLCVQTFSELLQNTDGMDRNEREPRRDEMPTQRRFLSQGREKRTRETLCALSAAGDDFADFFVGGAAAFGFPLVQELVAFWPGQFQPLVNLELIAAHPVVSSDQPLLQVANRAVCQGHNRLRAFVQVDPQRLAARHVLESSSLQPSIVSNNE
jgi:hypothetical protein